MSTQAHRVLVKGGYVLTMDPAIGELDRGDVLIEGDRIVQVARDIGPVDAEVVDARGTVVMPGMVDTHRHTWQALLRGIYADASIMQFFAGLRMNVIAQFGAEDVHIANYVGALEAIDSGVTTILDYSHCIHGPEHADAAVQGLISAGIRAVFAYGYVDSPQPCAFDTPQARMADARRIAGTYCSATDGLLTMGVALTEMGLIPWARHVEEIRSAQELDATMIMHTGAVFGTPMSHGIREMHHHGLLSHRQVHVHCPALDDEEWKMLADAGGKVSFSTDTEMGMGAGHPPIRKCLDMGMKPTLSCDTVSVNSGDLIAQMRMALQMQRWRDNDVLNAQDITPVKLTLSTRDAIGWATVNGAQACGLDRRIGSLTPGKQADLVLVGGTTLNMIPRPEPVGGVVLQANPSNVRTVLIGGRIMKRDGRLVGVDLDSVRDRAEKAQLALFDRAQIGDHRLPEVPERGFFEAMNPIWAANLAGAGLPS